MNKIITAVIIGLILGVFYLFTPNKPAQFDTELTISLVKTKTQKQSPLPTIKLNSISEAKPSQEIKPIPETKPIVKTINKPSTTVEVKIADLFKVADQVITISPKAKRNRIRQQLDETQAEFGKLLDNYEERTEYLRREELNTKEFRKLYTELYKYSKEIAKMQLDLDQKITQKVFGRPPWMAK